MVRLEHRAGGGGGGRTRPIDYRLVSGAVWAAAGGGCKRRDRWAALLWGGESSGSGCLIFSCFIVGDGLMFWRCGWAVADGLLRWV